MILLSHPTINAFNRALAEELERTGRLAAFHTTITFGRRSLAVPRQRLRHHPWRELGRLVAQRLGSRDPRGPLGIDAVYRALDLAVARNPGAARAVYCYEDGACATFQAARERGMPRFYELPIAYWETTQRLLREEAERLPEWAFTLQAPDDSPEKLERKTREMELADVVICPSQFVRASLPPGTRSIVAEFGSPPVPENCPPASRRGAAAIAVRRDHDPAQGARRCLRGHAVARSGRHRIIGTRHAARAIVILSPCLAAFHSRTAASASSGPQLDGFLRCARFAEHRRRARARAAGGAQSRIAAARHAQRRRRRSGRAGSDGMARPDPRSGGAGRSYRVAGRSPRRTAGHARSGAADGGGAILGRIYPAHYRGDRFPLLSRA